MCHFSFSGIALDREWRRRPQDLFQMKFKEWAQVHIVHIRLRYPTDMSASSQSIFGMLNGFTLDPGISDQFTDISIIGMPNHLHRNTNSTSKHHLCKINVEGQLRIKVLTIQKEGEKVPEQVVVQERGRGREGKTIGLSNTTIQTITLILSPFNTCR